MHSRLRRIAATGALTISLAGGALIGTSTATADPIQGSSPCIQGSCVSVAEDTAVQWAAAQAGATNWDGLCLQFVYDAYQAAGVDIGTADSAWAYWQAHPDLQRGGEPPAGALVFWGPEDINPYGHVALAIGDGTGWSTEERTSTGVHVLSIAERNNTKPYLGWILPA